MPPSTPAVPAAITHKRRPVGSTPSLSESLRAIRLTGRIADSFPDCAWSELTPGLLQELASLCRRVPSLKPRVHSLLSDYYAHYSDAPHEGGPGELALEYGRVELLDAVIACGYRIDRIPLHLCDGVPSDIAGRGMPIARQLMRLMKLDPAAQKLFQDHVLEHWHGSAGTRPIHLAYAAAEGFYPLHNMLSVIARSAITGKSITARIMLDLLDREFPHCSSIVVQAVNTGESELLVACAVSGNKDACVLLLSFGCDPDVVLAREVPISARQAAELAGKGEIVALFASARAAAHVRRARVAAGARLPSTP
jgi:hypothetical protein